jgi:hypothetical protein
MKKEEDKAHQTWFVRHEGVPMGSLTGAKIRHLMLDGELALNDDISLDGKHWQKIDSVPEVVPLQLRAATGDSGAQAMLNARRQSDALEVADEKRFPWLAMTLVVLVIGAVLGVAVWVGMPDAVDTPQCEAAPAPGVDWRNCILPGLDAGSASLAGANLNSAILRDAKFSATDLTGADLRYTDLSGADLRYARFTTAVLMGANLSGADLRGTDFTRVDLRFADLSRSLVDSAVFTDANLEGAIWIDGTTCGAGSVGRCLPEKP